MMRTPRRDCAEALIAAAPVRRTIAKTNVIILFVKFI
jgi:hypothetical protein